MVINYTVAQGLASNKVWCILEDKKENLWFGTLGGGVSRFDGKSFTNFTTSQGLPNNNIWCIFEDKVGNLWFGTYGGGISRFNGKTFTNFNNTQGLSDNNVVSIAEDKDGNLWFGTNGGGVSRYDGNRIDAILKGEKISLNGLFKINNSYVKSFIIFTTSQGLTNNNIWSITEDKNGDMWFATEGGISILNTIAANEILLKNLNQQILKQKGINKLECKLFKTITTKEGLPDNTVTQIVQSDEGIVYAGTNLGICEIISGNKNQYKIGRVFNSLTGFPVKDIVQASFLQGLIMLRLRLCA